jgi:hypothetical protein
MKTIVIPRLKAMFSIKVQELDFGGPTNHKPKTETKPSRQESGDGTTDDEEDLCRHVQAGSIMPGRNFPQNGVMGNFPALAYLDGRSFRNWDLIA